MMSQKGKVNNKSQQFMLPNNRQRITAPCAKLK